MAMLLITVWITLFVQFTQSQCDNYNAAQNLHFPVPVGICYYSLSTLHQQMSKQYICQQDINGTKAVEYAYHSPDCSGQGIQTGFRYPCHSNEDQCRCTIVNQGNLNHCDIAKHTVYLECTDDCTCDADKYQTYSYIANLCIEDENESHSFSCSGESIVASSVPNCTPRGILNRTNEIISPIFSDSTAAYGQCYEQRCGNNIGPRITMFAEEHSEKQLSRNLIAIDLWAIDLLVVFSVFSIVVGGLFFKSYCKGCRARNRMKYQRTDDKEDNEDDIEMIESISIQRVPTSPFSLTI